MADSEEMTFWEHLDVFRSSIIKMLVATVAAGIIAFLLKEPLFRIVLAPQDSNFFLWQWVGVEPFQLQLINTGLAEQFLIHMKVALVTGLIVASPYVLYILFSFVSPALYENERRYSVRITLSAYLMFLLGVAVNYFLVFPLTVRFLGTYQVNNSVENMLTISSYVDTLLMLSLMMGVVFELPVLSWLLAKFGLLRREWMVSYRKHAFVAILIVAAVITPTSDIFTLLIVSLPIWLLYECSIFIVGRVQKTNE